MLKPFSIILLHYINSTVIHLSEEDCAFWTNW